MRFHPIKLQVKFKLRAFLILPNFESPPDFKAEKNVGSKTKNRRKAGNPTLDATSTSTSPIQQAHLAFPVTNLIPASFGLD
jgi:hypothetical protein